MAGQDTKYLQELVGDALARGVAECVAAQPNDPVDYLGQWLLKFVKNAEIEGQIQEQRRIALESKKKKLEQQQAEALKQREAEAERKKAIAALAELDAEPRQLVQHAVELIKKFTSAGSAYAAAVAEPEEPDWTPPEDPEDPSAVESEDEADPDLPLEEDPAAEEPPVEENQETPPEEEKNPKLTPPVNYSKKYFSYMAANSGQEFMLTTELFRPAPPPEDAGEDFVPEPTAFTFRILDERRPMIYTPNVAFEPSIKFFRKFPKIGAYQACGVQVPASGGEFKAIIAAETLFPEGEGQALSLQDQDFVWEVSLALSKAYEARDKKVKEAQAAVKASELVEGLKKKIVDIYHPPPPEEGEEPAAPAPPAAPEPAAEEGDPDAEPLDDNPPGEDAEPIVVHKYDIRRLTKELKDSQEAREASSKSLALAEEALRVIKAAVIGISHDAVRALRDATELPQATYHVLKALLHLLQKEPESFKNWKRSFEHFSLLTFSELGAYDATQERDLEVWKRVRQAYKGIKDPKLLAEEMPNTHLGVFLLMFIKQVRKVGRKAATFRGHTKACEDLTAQLEQKKIDLAEAERIKAEEEEAARKAAEAAAAEEAAAAAAAEAGGEEAQEDE
ncbi:hypothetical protein CEUSTIGMA_g3120.t1 [Chlamydomonas eustigma]|uniref:Uncharacterized protein n=1 Tax=Chlamydomonas eustigma TaxID=1157962 RepID=A0A250WXW6_9CHLO|nr:hypothetical protein CEUSTIGMA_g3120.t1 [Chlamydomonas eustigma]|eukprot:GAX75677.1 hypothetical protein CEUSTIGMA_g3120.t1 [Chlamydomonas eustigma]